MVSLCFPELLGIHCACWNPWLLELVNSRLRQDFAASLQLAGTEPVCRDEIVTGLFSLDRCVVIFPEEAKSGVRVESWAPEDLG